MEILINSKFKKKQHVQTKNSQTNIFTVLKKLSIIFIAALFSLVLVYLVTAYIPLYIVEILDCNGSFTMSFDLSFSCDID